MAIVRSKDGHFFEVPDEELKKYEKKPEDVQDKDVCGNECSSEDCEGTPEGSSGPGGPARMGPPGSSSPIQIVVNYIQGGPGGGAPRGGKDISGRYCGWHNCWRNCWHNCWRNYCHY